MSKPELIRSPAGPNTIVDDNLKVNAFIFPVNVDDEHLPELEEIQGRCFVSSTDKRLYILDDDGVYNPVAYLSDTSIANALINLASGTKIIGDADTNHTDVGDGTTVTFDIGIVLHSTNYMVILTIISLSDDPQNDLFHNVTIREKTTATFDVYFRETADLVQNINVDWLIIPLAEY
jgi:hypothetical protein